MRLLLPLLVLLAVMPLQADEWWMWSTVEFYRQPPWTGLLCMGSFSGLEA